MFLAMMMAMTITANAMSYRAARNEALFLSDKMAYELNLTDAQYEAVYEINLDYLMSVNGRADVFGPWWDRRNADLRYVLTTWQYARFLDRTYFYRPVTWRNGGLTIHVYSHYDRARFYRHHPTGTTASRVTSMPIEDWQSQHLHPLFVTTIRRSTTRL